MKDFFRIFSLKMRGFFGEPANPVWKIDREAFMKTENAQIIGSFLYGYHHEHSENEWSKSPILLEATEVILQEMFKLKNYHPNRVSYVLMEAFPLLKKYLPHLSTSFEPMLKGFATHFGNKLIDRQYLTQLTSANVGYGTNHLAVELKVVTQYFKYCEKSLGVIPGINETFLKNFLQRFMEYMNPEGYWPETDGPALIYNRLTGSTLLDVAIELNELETYRKHFEKVSDFHVYTTMPDGRLMDILDGRNSNGSFNHLGSFLPLTPFGNDWYQKMMPLCEKDIDTCYSFGQALEFLRASEKIKDKYGVKESVSVWKAKSLEKKINDFTIVKNDLWIAGISTFKFRPRPEGHFTFDHQNIFSLFHTEFGEIFGGQNSKNDPEIATFSKFMNTFDGDPVTKPMPKYIPGNGKASYLKNKLSVERDYRGFEGCLSIEFKDSHLAELTLFARARANEYPIQCNLILPCGSHKPFFDANQKTIPLDESAKLLTNKEVGSFVYFPEYKNSNILAKGKNRKLKLSVPNEATIQWPFKPWDTYNTVSDRELLPNKWYCVMHINLTNEPVKLKIEIV